jgi:hypothetical protein
VKNGDRWVVTGESPEGGLWVTRALGQGTVHLPADYVAQHVELAYATTAHGAQGRTVDSSHSLVSAASTQALLYVGMTRGRAANHLYVDTASDPDPATSHDPLVERADARAVLEAVLGRPDEALSAHETLIAARAAERVGASDRVQYPSTGHEDPRHRAASSHPVPPSTPILPGPSIYADAWPTLGPAGSQRARDAAPDLGPTL